MEFSCLSFSSADHKRVPLITIYVSLSECILLWTHTARIGYTKINHSTAFSALFSVSSRL